MGIRSHHGCARCKRRRQKCNEARPSCKRCLDAAVPCDYPIVLKWNGRVPRDQPPSRPKRTNSANLEVNTGDGPFVDLVHAAVDYFQRGKDDAAPIRGHQALMRGLTPFDQFTASQKLLLHHFVTYSSMISSHSYLRQRMCEQVSLALEIPSLMHATMALAALHRASLLGSHPSGFVPEPMVSDLTNQSLSSLWCEIEAYAPNRKHLLLHTIRTLCTCEIYSGKAESSWRVHVNGARAVLASASAESEWLSCYSAHWLTLRWYESIQSLAALTERCLHANPADTLTQDEDRLWQPDSNSHSFDLYTGYSSDLNVVFQEIGRAAMDARVKDQPDGQIASRDLREKANSLEHTVRRMIFRDAIEGLRLPSGVSMSKEEVEQFNVCNTAYQYSALIHILRKLQKQLARSEEVQSCVRSILDAVCTILPVSTLSPWVLLTTPIFAAG